MFELFQIFYPVRKQVYKLEFFEKRRIEMFFIYYCYSKIAFEKRR